MNNRQALKKFESEKGNIPPFVQKHKNNNPKLITMDNNRIIKPSDEEDEEVVFYCIVDAPSVFRDVNSKENSEEQEEPKKK